MLTPDDISKIDQAQSAIRDFYVPGLWGFYKACTEQGFTPDQALSVLLKYMELMHRPL